MPRFDCPSCQQSTRPVGAETLDALLTADGREAAGATDGYRFCKTESCPVVYVRPEDGRVLEADVLRVEVFQKSTNPERHACYCFNHTVASLQTEVARTGESKVPKEITDACRAGLDRCEVTNPQGTCCLGNVRAVVKTAQGAPDGRPAVSAGVETHAKVAQVDADLPDCCAVDAAAEPGPTADETMVARQGNLAVGGAVFAAVFSSACCWLPLGAIAIGASAAGVGSFFEAWRPYFLGLTGLFLAAGFYLVYFRKPKCAPGEACAVPNLRLQRLNKVMLWGASAVVIGFALFPNYVSALLGGTESAAVTAEGPVMTSVYVIEGMTCEGCAANVRAAVERLPGVLGVEVSYPDRTATLKSRPGAGPTDAQIEAVVSEFGYHTTLIEGPAS